MLSVVCGTYYTMENVMTETNLDNVLKYFNWRGKNLERLGRRHGLWFHVDCYEPWVGGKCRQEGQFVSHNCAEDEVREATDAEVAMWYRLVGTEVDLDNLPATKEEMLHSLRYKTGPFTMNAVDFALLRNSYQDFGFTPCTMREVLLTGLVGWVRTDQDSRGIDLYLSRKIPVGFFYEGPRLAALHTPTGSGSRSEVISEMTEAANSSSIFIELDPNLHPFQMDG